MKLDLFSRLPGAAAGDRERRLVEVRIGGVRYGIDIMSVSEVVGPRPLIPVAGAPEHVIGVADHRARLVPVVDLRRRLGVAGTEPDPRAKWVIVRPDGSAAAILVDRVAGVILVQDRDRRERHPLVSGAETEWIRDVYGHGGGLVFELDLAAVTGGAREAAERVQDPQERR
jgi:purine-binding chemotaxis protein CheW